MMDLLWSARNIAGAEIDTGNARCEKRGAEGAGHPVDEHRARGNLGSLIADAGDRRIADVELHRRLGAALVGVALRAEPVGSGREIEREPLRLAAIAAARGKAEIAPAHQAFERFCPCGRRRRDQQEQAHD